MASNRLIYLASALVLLGLAVTPLAGSEHNSGVNTQEEVLSAVKPAKGPVQPSEKKKARAAMEGGRLERAGIVNVYLEENVPQEDITQIRQGAKMLGQVLPLKFKVGRKNKPRLPQIKLGKRCEENAERGSWGLAWGEWFRISYGCDIPEPYLIRQVIVHELGHAVGVPHIETEGLIMSAAVMPTLHPEISPEDAAWIQQHFTGYPGKVYKWVIK